MDINKIIEELKYHLECKRTDQRVKIEGINKYVEGYTEATYNCINILRETSKED